MSYLCCDLILGPFHPPNVLLPFLCNILRKEATNSFLRKFYALGGLEWTAIHGSVSISAFHVKDLITDGLNEQGFAVHALALGLTQYEERNDRPGIHYGEWLQYLLDTCKTVEEALNAHNNFQVVQSI